MEASDRHAQSRGQLAIGGFAVTQVIEHARPLAAHLEEHA
jgi:hypothetical protein